MNNRVLAPNILGSMAMQIVFDFSSNNKEQSLPLQQQQQPQPQQQIVTSQTQDVIKEFVSSPSKISFLVANPSGPTGSASGGTQFVAEVPQSVVGEFSRQEIQTAATQIVTSLLHRVTDQDGAPATTTTRTTATTTVTTTNPSHHLQPADI